MVDHVVRLQARGLTLELEGDQLMVSPARRLDPPSAAEIAAYRDEVVEAMRAERAALVQDVRNHRDEIVDALRSGDMWEERRTAYGEAYRAPVEFDPPDDGWEVAS